MDDYILASSILTKTISGLGGFVGGAFYMIYSRPANVWDASLRSSVSTAVAIIGAAPFLKWLDVDLSISMLIASGAFLGFCSWSLLSFLARNLVDAEKGDIKLKLPFIQRNKKQNIYDERTNQDDQYGIS